MPFAPTAADCAAFDLLANLAADGVIVLAFGDGRIQAAAWGRDAVDKGLAESMMDAILAAIESGCVRPVAKAERPKKRRAASAKIVA